MNKRFVLKPELQNLCKKRWNKNSEINSLRSDLGLLQEDCKLDALAVLHTSVKLAQQLGGEDRIMELLAASGALSSIGLLEPSTPTIRKLMDVVIATPVEAYGFWN
ncbi:uncharacterized protein G2W53_007187 [Senna tora]|uniref:Uncharacterized protein n=1 Tax=Senna tora TaxID=362788 RepID=A0A834X6A9_9FABA|nr:uncharacterized protein G2W53_007187 [Senna tora]